MKSNRSQKTFIECLENRRLLSGGPFDATFGAGGLAAGITGPTELLPNEQMLVDVNTTGKIVRLNANGSVDKTFNSKGVVDDWKQGTVRQSDGKLLVLSGGTLSRYNTNGMLDSTFGAGGKVSTFYVNSHFTSFTPTDIALQGSKIIVAGFAVTAGETVVPEWAVERLNSNGLIDSSFGLHFTLSSKIVPDENIADSNLPVRVQVAPDGTIWTLGVAANGSGYLARWGENGADDSQGTAFETVLNEGITPNSDSPFGGPMTLAIGADGRPVVAGENGQATVVVERFNYNTSTMAAAPDTTLGGLPNTAPLPDENPVAGLEILHPAGTLPPNGYSSVVQSLVIQPDGKILLGVSEGTLRILQNTNNVGTTVSGHVWHDANGDGVQQASEQPIAGRTVFLDLNHNGKFDPGEPITTTNSKGNFSFANVKPGTVDIVEVLPNADWLHTFPDVYQNAWPNALPISATIDEDGDPIAPVNIGDAVRVKIEGTVDTPANTPVKGVTVWVDVNHSSELKNNDPTAVTDKYGDYTLVLPPGSYTPLIEGNYVLSTPNNATFTLSENQTVHENFVVTAPTPAGHGSISGSVTTLQADETPGLANWDVYVDLNNNGVWDPGEPLVSTNTHGNYTLDFPALNNRSTLVIREIRLNGWTRLSPTGAWPAGGYTVNYGANTANVNFVNIPTAQYPLPTNGSVFGHVFDDVDNTGYYLPGDPGISGVGIYIDLTDSGVYKAGDPIVYTDANGFYNLNLPADDVNGRSPFIRQILPAGYTRISPAGAWPQGGAANGYAPENLNVDFANIHTAT